MTSNTLQDALKSIKYPGFSRDIVSFGLVRSADVVEGRALVKLAVTTGDATIPATIKKQVEQAALAVPGVRDVIVEIAVTAPKTTASAAGAPPTGMPGVRYTVAVASGKGGVGKSTFAVNLACALAQLFESRGKFGAVGLMDCDIYGPSVPLMMGLEGRPEIEGDHLLPLERFGVKVMSMGFLVDGDTPVIWRGPMVMKTIQQFVQNVRWGELEILIVDLPPGTGDAQLSLVQTIPLSGALLVTTPQLAATQVARRGGLMFSKVNVPLLGVVENMSYLELPDGSRLHVFGSEGGSKTARSLDTPLLGEVPLSSDIREGGDSGEPATLRETAGPTSRVFKEIAQKLLDALASTHRKFDTSA
ncbi:iron-sulfur cluster carrier protein ApbC [Opitutales bacterium ASA1]|uniref:Mrp/NBP35 family ATP-binding protein n=1 Tax=Congregicoccus parvus TaxID=3081749 RepID=UPI002B316DD2|nr:iron-sulfur cluster carrier protein ApbC [Opitutales bacterium ASA1]